MLDVARATSPLDDLEPVADAAEIRAGRGGRAHPRRRGRPAVRRRPRHRHAQHPDLRLGASPRATLHLVRAAKAYAGLDGRDYVLPDDVQTLAVPVLAHRLLPSVEAAMSGRSVGSIVDRIVASVPVPDAGSST